MNHPKVLANFNGVYSAIGVAPIRQSYLVNAAALALHWLGDIGQLTGGGDFQSELHLFLH